LLALFSIKVRTGVLFLFFLVALPIPSRSPSRCRKLTPTNLDLERETSSKVPLAPAVDASRRNIGIIT
jgi:hypothetical protein